MFQSLLVFGRTMATNALYARSTRLDDPGLMPAAQPDPGAFRIWGPIYTCILGSMLASASDLPSQVYWRNILGLHEQWMRAFADRRFQDASRILHTTVLASYPLPSAPYASDLHGTWIAIADVLGTEIARRADGGDVDVDMSLDQIVQMDQGHPVVQWVVWHLNKRYNGEQLMTPPLPQVESCPTLFSFALRAFVRY